MSRNWNLRLLKQRNFGGSLLQREYTFMKIGKKLSRLLRWLRVPVLKLLQTERMLRNLLKESVIISHLQASPLYVCLQWKWDHLTEVSGELHLCKIDSIDFLIFFLWEKKQQLPYQYTNNRKKLKGWIMDKLKCKRIFILSVEMFKMWKIF